MSSEASDGANRRADVRLGVQLPVRVQGFDPDGTRWEEMTTGTDISSGGASFVLKHPAMKGQAVVLSLPLPKRFRAFDLAENSYRVFALVRSVEVAEEGFLLGVIFIGKNPPKGYEDKPGTRYLLPGESKPERRGEARFQVFVTFRMRRDDDATGANAEFTVAENLSKGGARVPTSLAVARGDLVFLEEIGGDFKTRAEVRNIFVGKDKITRLSLKFLDHKVPDRLIASS